jgi:hypothetical protein
VPAAPSSPALSLVDESEGVLLHLPPQMEYDNFAHPSLTAAIMLGLRQVIGGSPEHLAVATIRDALRAADRRALLIHDTVPGGTGCLAEFADHTKVWAVLAAARQIVRDCLCPDEDRLACHRCLLPFASPHEMDKVSRATALKLLDDILNVEPDATRDLDAWRTFLHPEQRKYAESNYSGAFRLSGGAGTGKTVVAIHRARRLARENPSARIILTTFNATFAQGLRAGKAHVLP